MRRRLCVHIQKDYSLTQFEDLGLGDNLLKAIKTEGYDSPTPIQARTIPAMIEGRDIVGIAQTGTGKTAAFVLPILQKIDAKHVRPAQNSCKALIMAPTRELAAQIADSIRAYGQFMHVTVAVIVGGVKPKPQIRAMARGVDIIVATPGRLEDHIANDVIRIDQCTQVVLDEADQMMDLGFMPAIRRLMGKLPAARQTILLSATMPRQIRALASDFLDDPVEVRVAPQSRPIELIAQKIYLVDQGQKRRLLMKILDGQDMNRAIVFTRTKHGANKVVQVLEKEGFTAAAIHGNKSQNQRQKTLNAFRAGDLNILIATDIAARGIDIDDVSHVINFELPNVAESYVHRIGRTARAGKSGIAISLCDTTEQAYLRDIEKLISQSLTKEKVSVEGDELVFTPNAQLNPNAARPPGPKRNPRRHSRSGSRSGGRSNTPARSGQKARRKISRGRR